MQSLPCTIRGVVMSGHKQSRLIGLPTANIKSGTNCSVDEGSYAGWASIGGAVQKFPSLIFFGTPYAIKEVREPRFEVYLLDQIVELYGKSLEVTLEKFLRSNEKFSNEQDLFTAIHNDHERAKKYFEATTSYQLIQ